MKAPDFAYARPRSLHDAFALKAAHGDGARWLAGGQSLLAALAFRLSEPTALIDISRLPELHGFALDTTTLRIGAATTHAELGDSDLIRQHVPLLAQAIPQIAHVAIRNRGTIGGSLAFADPAAELPACCVALNATIVATGPDGERRIPAHDFFHGVYATALTDAELITAIEIPVIDPGQHHALVEVTRRSGDYAMAGIAAALTFAAGSITAARLMFFAVGDRPVVAASAARALVGHRLDDTRIAAAVAACAADLDPAGDLNGTPDTKRHLAGVVLKRALQQIKSEANA